RRSRRPPRRRSFRTNTAKLSEFRQTGRGQGIVRRGLVFLTAVVAGLAWVLPAGMAHAADLSNGSTAYSQIGDCPDGVGAVSVGPTTPPLFVNHMGFGAEVGTVASQCATSHFTLAVKATLFTASSDNPSLEGVAVAQVLESCN